MLAVATVGTLLAEGSFVDIDKALFYSTFVLFGLFALVLGKFGWGPLLKIVEEREKGIHEAVEGAQKAKVEAESLLNQHRELLREATREREEIVKRALAEAEQMRSDASARAKAEGEQLIQRAKEQIEREKSRAIQDLRAEVGQLAIDAAARIVQSSLNAETQKKLVDDFITALPRAR
jgi:F-type H+-transporting ATPase subunit b